MALRSYASQPPRDCSTIDVNMSRMQKFRCMDSVGAENNLNSFVDRPSRRAGRGAGDLFRRDAPKQYCSCWSVSAFSTTCCWAATTTQAAADVRFEAAFGRLLGAANLSPDLFECGPPEHGMNWESPVGHTGLASTIQDLYNFSDQDDFDPTLLPQRVERSRSRRLLDRQHPDQPRTLFVPLHVQRLQRPWQSSCARPSYSRWPRPPEPDHVLEGAGRVILPETHPADGLTIRHMALLSGITQESPPSHGRGRRSGTRCPPATKTARPSYQPEDASVMAQVERTLPSTTGKDQDRRAPPPRPASRIFR